MHKRLKGYKVCIVAHQRTLSVYETCSNYEKMEARQLVSQNKANIFRDYAIENAAGPHYRINMPAQ